MVCPSCRGTDFGRAGLATRFSRALAAGVHYDVTITDYTGGDGNKKSLGVNIIIRKLAERG